MGQIRPDLRMARFKKGKRKDRHFTLGGCVVPFGILNVLWKRVPVDLMPSFQAYGPDPQRGCASAMMRMRLNSNSFLPLRHNSK
jgi:hypothetical protein